MVQKQVKRIVVLVIGWSLIGLGIVGLAVPILQGVLFILLGLFVLSRESLWARRHFESLRQRFPRLEARLQEWKHRLGFGGRE